MKIDNHMLFLIVVIGIISVGLVGATVMTSDTSMKEEVFDGITVSVPSDSNFVKVGDGVYKDSNHGIKINTFKNNASMISFLKNTKNSKIIPVDDQPPQSIAFKKGDNINILVTNGNEGLSVSTKDGELSAKIANSIVFSNNHKSEKPSGIGVVSPKMDVHQDFNLILLLVADVDTNVFNLNAFQENLFVVVDNYNLNIEEPLGDSIDDEASEDSQSGEYVSDISSQDDLDSLLSDSEDNETASTSVLEDNNDEVNDDNVFTSLFSDDNVEDSSSNADNNDLSANAPAADVQSNNQQEMSFEDCQDLAKKEVLENVNLGSQFTVDELNHDEIPDCYVFFVMDDTNVKVAEITVNALNGNVDTIFV